MPPFFHLCHKMSETITLLQLYEAKNRTSGAQLGWIEWDGMDRWIYFNIQCLSIHHGIDICKAFTLKIVEYSELNYIS